MENFALARYNVFQTRCPNSTPRPTNNSNYTYGSMFLFSRSLLIFKLHPTTLSFSQETLLAPTTVIQMMVYELLVSGVQLVQEILMQNGFFPEPILQSHYLDKMVWWCRGMLKNLNMELEFMNTIAKQTGNLDLFLFVTKISCLGIKAYINFHFCVSFSKT